MALIKKDATDTVEVNATVVDSTVPEPEVKVEVQTTEVAVKAPSAPAAKGGSFWFNNEAVQEVVASATYGDFPQVIAAQGTFSTSGSSGEEVGKTIIFKPILKKTKWVCAPGSNDDEAKEYFAAAYEGELTADGKTIDECVEDAKAAGYDKAAKKEYADLFAYVVSHESGSALENETVILQLSPMSRISWGKFSKKLEMKAAFGQLIVNEDGLSVKAVAKATKNKGGQAYTYYEFELA